MFFFSPFQIKLLQSKHYVSDVFQYFSIQYLYVFLKSLVLMAKRIGTYTSRNGNITQGKYPSTAGTHANEQVWSA